MQVPIYLYRYIIYVEPARKNCFASLLDFSSRLYNFNVKCNTNQYEEGTQYTHIYCVRILCSVFFYVLSVFCRVSAALSALVKYFQLQVPHGILLAFTSVQNIQRQHTAATLYYTLQLHIFAICFKLVTTINCWYNVRWLVR